MVQKIDAEQVKSYVEYILDDLQDKRDAYGSRIRSSPDDIANRIRMEGLKGRRNDTCSCIIARFIREKMREAGMGPNHLRISYDNNILIVRIVIQNQSIVIEDKSQVAHFISLFDDGEYADLDSKKKEVKNIPVIADVTKKGQGIGYRYIFKNNDDIECHTISYNYHVHQEYIYQTRGNALKEIDWLISRGFVRQMLTTQ